MSHRALHRRSVACRSASRPLLSDSTVVRPERDGDQAEILRVVESAFGSRREAGLVEALRASEFYVPELSLVSEVAGTLVGHTMLTRVSVEGDEGSSSVLSLSPLSVLPAHQRRGVGSRLVAEALARARDAGESLVLVEGDPSYYGKRGFEDARNHGIVFKLPDWAPPEAGQIAVLEPARLVPKGYVRYSPPFDNLD